MSASRLLLGLVLVLLVGLGAFFVLEDGRVDPGALDGQAATTPGSRSQESADLTTPPRAGATAPRQAGEGMTTVAFEPGEARVAGRVLLTDTQPVADALVEVWTRPLASWGVPDFEASAWRERVAAVRTDAGGRFDLAVPGDRVLDLVVRHDVALAPVLRDVLPGSEVLLIAGEPADLRGIVVDAKGAPLVGARIFGWEPNGFGRVFDERPVFANGTFLVEDLAPGRLVVEVRQGPDVIAVRPVELANGGGPRLELRAKSRRSLTGYVLAAGSETPLEGARVGLDWTLRNSVTTGPDGRFTLERTPGLTTELVVEAQGYGRAEFDVEGDGPVRVELEPGRTVTGRLVDGEGGALVGAYVGAGAARADGGGLDWKAVRSGSDGTFVLRDLRSDGAHSLFVRAPGYGTRVLDLPAVERFDAGALVLSPGRRVLGQATDEQGQPYEAATIVLRGAEVERTQAFAGREPDRPLALGPARSAALDAFVATRRLPPDAQGRFAFDDVAAGNYELVLRVRDKDLATVAVNVGPNRDPVPTFLVAPAQTVLDGIVRDPLGRPAHGSLVLLAGTARARPVDANGHFRFHDIDGGSLRVIVLPPAASDAQVLAPRFIPARRGAALDLTLQRPVPLEGRVLGVDGASAPPALVLAHSARGEFLASTVVRSDGSFTLAVPPDASPRLTAIATAGLAFPALEWRRARVRAQAERADLGTIVLRLAAR